MNHKDKRNWTALTADARRAEAPDIDVLHAVMAEIRQSRRTSETEPSIPLLAAIDALITRSWVRATLATAATVACGIGYSGYQGSTLMEIANVLII